MEAARTARLERLKEVRKRSTEIAKERVREYQKQRNLARRNEIKFFMEQNDEFLRWEAQKQIEEEAAAIFHVGEAHRNAAVATVMDEMRQKREKMKKEDIEAARKERSLAAANKLDMERGKNAKRIEESRIRRAAVASRAAAERYAAAEFGASIKEAAEAKEAYEKEAARRLALWIERYAQVSREHTYVPQAATVLPDVRESVMVPVDVVKHGSQPGKQLAAIQGSTLTLTTPMGTEGGITVVNVNDDADTERNKFRQAEYMKALKLKGFAESAEFRGHKALSKDHDIHVTRNVDEKFQIYAHSLKLRGCRENDDEVEQNYLATMKVKEEERLKRRSLPMSARRQYPMVVESDKHCVTLAIPKAREELMRTVEAEVPAISSDLSQSVIINKMREDRQQQQEYQPLLPQQQRRHLVLVSEKPHRGTTPVTLDVCPLHQATETDHPREPEPPYPEGSRHTQAYNS